MRSFCRAWAVGIIVTLLSLLLTGLPAVAGEKAKAKKREKATVLFVVNATGGSVAEIEGGSFPLELTGVDPDALFFTDRPARDTGVMGVGRMLSVLADGQKAPPNGVVEVFGGEAGPTALAVELTDAQYDPAASTLRYTAKVLKESKGSRLRHYDDRLDEQLPATFGRVAVFIDTSPFGSTNFCGTTVQNYTEQNVTLTAQGKWDTDTWDPAPSGNGFVLGLGDASSWQSDGGFARGCGNSTSWRQDDGTTFTTSLTDPYGGDPNSISCTSSDSVGHPCHIDPGSTTRGPDIGVTFYFCDFARQNVCPGQ